MEEAKFNNLCAHYKDTFDNHRLTIKQRDTLFYGLLITLAIFTLQLSSGDSVVNVVNAYAKSVSGVQFGNNVEFVSTLMWLLLLGFSTRYYQIVLEIERQYTYLHALEEHLNGFYPGSKAFTREGKSYLSKYPLFLNWVWFLYTLVFPFLVLVIITTRIIAGSTCVLMLELNQIIDCSCFASIFISTVFYIYRLHETSIAKIVDS